MKSAIFAQMSRNSGLAMTDFLVSTDASCATLMNRNLASGVTARCSLVDVAGTGPQQRVGGMPRLEELLLALSRHLETLIRTVPLMVPLSSVVRRNGQGMMVDTRESNEALVREYLDAVRTARMSFQVTDRRIAGTRTYRHDAHLPL
jgi:hypothetical protein